MAQKHLKVCRGEVVKEKLADHIGRGVGKVKGVGPHWSQSAAAMHQGIKPIYLCLPTRRWWIFVKHLQWSLVGF